MHFAPPQSLTTWHLSNETKQTRYLCEGKHRKGLRVSRVNEYVRGADDFIKRRIHHARYARMTVSISLKWRFGGHPLTLKISFRTRVKCFAPQTVPKRFPSRSLSIDYISSRIIHVVRDSHQTYFSRIKSWDAEMAFLRARMINPIAEAQTTIRSYEIRPRFPRISFTMRIVATWSRLQPALIDRKKIVGSCIFLLLWDTKIKASSPERVSLKLFADIHGVPGTFRDVVSPILQMSLLRNEITELANFPRDERKSFPSYFSRHIPIYRRYCRRLRQIASKVSWNVHISRSFHFHIIMCRVSETDQPDNVSLKRVTVKELANHRLHADYYTMHRFSYWFFDRSKITVITLVVNLNNKSV